MAQVGKATAAGFVIVLLASRWRRAQLSLGRGERTVHQHAVAVCQKAGRAGRAGLAACFLEDLLPSAADGDLTPYHGTGANLETGDTEART